MKGQTIVRFCLKASSGLTTLLLASTLFGGSAQAGGEVDFKSFPQDSCDPLLVGVLTGNGYENSDLARLYQVAYGTTVAQACGLTKTANLPSDGGFQNIDPLQPELPPLDGGGLTSNLPALPPTDPLDLPEPTDFVEDDVASTSGFYLAAKGAYLFPQDSEFTLTDTSANAGGTSDVSGTHSPSAENGYGGSGSLGYRFGFSTGLLQAFRAEAQGSYYQFDLGEGTVSTSFSDSEGTAATYDSVASGQETVYGGFANVYADLGLFDLPIRPYVGGGVGYGQRKSELVYTDGGTNELARELTTQGIMYQGMAGLGYDFTERLGLEVGYKYLVLPEHEVTEPFATGPYTLSGGTRDVHIIEAGVSVRF